MIETKLSCVADFYIHYDVHVRQLTKILVH